MARSCRAHSEDDRDTHLTGIGHMDSSALAFARGDQPSDLLFRRGRVANVFSGDYESVDVAVAGGLIVGVGPDYRAREVIDLDGAVLAPGLIDAHVHIESSMVVPSEFARAVVPRGTTTVVVDPHEIANVHGAEGIRFMLEASDGIPLDVIVQLPSCVPATPMATGGAVLEAEDLEEFLDHDRILGLAEVMNFPGVIHGDPGLVAKLNAFAGRPIDGHAPGLGGQGLNAYIVGGPSTDHECTTPEEALEKLRRGLWIFFREATNARNLDALLPVLRPETAARICLCTDDRQPADLLDVGGIDHMLRRVISAGHDPFLALRLATLNPSLCFGLSDRGAIAPGRRADLVVTESLEDFRPTRVFVRGVEAGRMGRYTGPAKASCPAPTPRVHIETRPADLRITREGESIRVIRAIEDQLVTGHEIWDPTLVDGEAVADSARDLLKLAVIERHGGHGGVGLGFVAGLGLQRGAIGGTVAHDHHNLIVCGADDPSMIAAARAIAAMGGGLAVAAGGVVVETLALPVGGLMSAEPVEVVRIDFDRLLEAARALGARVHDPFMALSFLGLEVIPALKLTDQGLVDVDAFERVPLWL
jgi:adenine deaminase